MSNNKEVEEIQSAKQNWWEGYVIRYALGSLVGAIICWFLIMQLPEKSIVRLFLHSKEVLVNYVVAMLMGLSFCYMASAPILIIHVSRYQERRNFLPRVLNVAPILSFLGWLVFGVFLLYCADYFSGDFDFRQLKIISLLVLMMFFVVVVQVSFLPYRTEDVSEFFEYYDKLSFLRYYTFTDIMTSYRHLREHGNAYAVMILELFLGLALLLALKIHVFLVPLVVLGWIVPAAYVWQVGSNIEKMYLQKYYEVAKRKHSYRFVGKSGGS